MDQMMQESMNTMGLISGFKSFDQGLTDGISVEKREDNKFKYVDILGDGIKRISQYRYQRWVDSNLRQVKKTVEEDIQGRKSRSEFISSFQRVMPIPEGVDQDNPQFESSDDKITIKFPKRKKSLNEVSAFRHSFILFLTPSE